MSDDTFSTLVESGIAALPLWVREKLVNVVFLVYDIPTQKQITEHELTPSDVLFGLYEGVPLSERGDESPLLPDTITLFKNAILSAYTEKADIQECVHNTIWHEVAHFLGHDEEWVAQEEVKRGKMK